MKKKTQSKVKSAKQKKASVKTGASPFHVTIHSIKARGLEIQVAEVVFSDPESRNSLRVGHIPEFEKILKTAEKEADAFVFRAEGPFFCSGGNLKDHLAAGTNKAGAAKTKAANRKIAACLNHLGELKVPTVAIVEGDALGGGIELLSAFDTVYSAPHVVFGFWQRRLGVTFGWGGGARLEKRIGSQATAAAGIDARAWTTLEAKSLGLIDHIVASWNVRREAMAHAIRVASLPRESVRAMKSRTAQNEQRVFESLWMSEDHKKALSRFQGTKQVRP